MMKRIHTAAFVLGVAAWAAGAVAGEVNGSTTNPK